MGYRKINLDENKVINLYKDGYTISEIGFIFKVSDTFILKILKKNNIPRRKAVRRPLNLLNKKFGKLTVIKYLGVEKNNSVWLCRCECGNLTKVTQKQLTRKDKEKRTKSCGCLLYKGMKGPKNPMYGKKPYNYLGPDEVKLRHKIREANRRSIKKSSIINLTENEKKKIELYYKIAHYLGPNWHVDHIIPLSKGGLHHPDNLQIVTKKYNLQKGDKLNFRKPDVLEYFRL